MKQRMTKYLRTQLSLIVNSEIVRHDLAAILKERQAVVEPLIRAVVEARYPPAEMAILLRYDCAIQDICVYLQLYNGQVDQFSFSRGTGPLRPSLGGCSRRVYGLGLETEKITEVFLAWKVAQENHLEGNKKLRADYYALIDGARYLSEVVEVWPRAAQLLQKSTSTEVSVVTPELIARIRADQAARTEPVGFGEN